jgi:protein-S-isoprenylcysteine O-methyltransferase Ste14
MIGIAAYGRLTYAATPWAGMPLDCEMLIILLYVGWTWYELTITKNETGQKAQGSDRGTREFYGTAQALVILSALFFEDVWTGPGPAHAIGLALFLYGVSFRIWAIRTLGQYYAHVVRIIDGHRIVDAGPYRLLRHPAYAGNLAAHAGITLFFLNEITLIAYLFLLLPSIIIRIIMEEKALMTIVGYQEFARERKRLVPFVW